MTAAAEEEAGTPRRDPSEKQEPHTVMWGNIEYTISNKHRFTFQHFRRDSHTCVRELLDAGTFEPILSDLDQSEGHWMEKK